mmetsp:Transcript_13711/g.38640  ORF Transcript_13711/g.38640 Transcript_13711/m.38640 type:complete len:250 (+) Transcript_13711:252-1001(+)
MVETGRASSSRSASICFSSAFSTTKRMDFCVSCLSLAFTAASSALRAASSECSEPADAGATVPEGSLGSPDLLCPWPALASSRPTSRGASRGFFSDPVAVFLILRWRAHSLSRYLPSYPPYARALVPLVSVSTRVAPSQESMTSPPSSPSEIQTPLPWDPRLDRSITKASVHALTLLPPPTITQLPLLIMAAAWPALGSGRSPETASSTMSGWNHSMLWRSNTYKSLKHLLTLPPPKTTMYLSSTTVIE